MTYEECKQWCMDMYTKLFNEGKVEEANNYGNMYGIWDDKHKATQRVKKDYAKTYVGGELGL